MNARTIAQATSMRDAILGLFPGDFRSIEMRVVQERPLRLQDVRDEKLILEGSILVVPQWLSDFELNVDIETTTEYSYVHDRPHKYTAKKMTVRNHLRVGEHVIVFEVARDRKYIVFDRRAQL